MGWLRRIGRGVVAATRWVLRNTRERLSPRGQLVFDWISGLLLIVIGVIGGFVPILQGWVFILAGLAILSNHSALARRWFDSVKRMGRLARQRLRDKSKKPE